MLDLADTSASASTTSLQPASFPRTDAPWRKPRLDGFRVALLSEQATLIDINGRVVDEPVATLSSYIGRISGQTIVDNKRNVVTLSQARFEQAPFYVYAELLRKNSKVRQLASVCGYRQRILSSSTCSASNVDTM